MESPMGVAAQGCARCGRATRVGNAAKLDAGAKRQRMMGRTRSAPRRGQSSHAAAPLPPDIRVASRAAKRGTTGRAEKRNPSVAGWQNNSRVESPDGNSRRRSRDDARKHGSERRIRFTYSSSRSNTSRSLTARSSIVNGLPIMSTSGSRTPLCTTAFLV